MAGRGLDQVLHYLIPEEEQVAARARVTGHSAEAAEQAPVCWWIGIDARRALARSAAVEIAAAHARQRGRARVLASFEPGHWLSPGPDVSWSVCRAEEGVPRRADPGARPDLIFLREDELASALPLPDPARDAPALLVDASARGVEGARRWLADNAERLGSQELGVIVSGASTRAAAQCLTARIADDARRRVGIEVNYLGGIQRDAARFRALLEGASLLQLDPGSRVAGGLEALARTMVSAGSRDGARRARA